MRILALLTLSIGTFLSACGGNVNVGEGGGGAGGDPTTTTPTGGAGGTTSSTTTGSAGSTTSSTTTTGTIPPGFCDAACTTFAEGSCFNTAICTDYCDQHAQGWVPSIADAFAKCAAENPLCFESVEGCILGEMYPPDASHKVILSGSGFGAYDGKILRAWHDPEAGAPFGDEVPLAGGQFAFEWIVPFPASDAGGPLLLLYIDVDGDGLCKPAVDITHSAFTEWNGDYLSPVFSATLTPPLGDADFVCSFTP